MQRTTSPRGPSPRPHVLLLHGEEAQEGFPGDPAVSGGQDGHRGAQ